MLKIIKKQLYKKYNLNLIEMEYDQIRMKKYSEIQSYLSTFFNKILSSKMLRVDEKQLYPKSLTNEKLLEELMKFSKDQDFLPEPSKLKRTNGYKFYEEVLKRYKYHDFAEKFNKKIKKTRNFWTIEKVYAEFISIIENGYSLTKSSLKNLKRLDLISYIDNNGGIIKIKTNFFYDNPQFLKNNDDIKFIIRTAKNNFRSDVPTEFQQKAKHLIESNVILNNAI